MNVKYTKFIIGFCIIWTFGGPIGCDSQPATEDSNVNTLISEGDANATAQKKRSSLSKVVTGPEKLIQSHLSELAGKKIGIIANHTALVFGGVHLVDSLVALEMDILRVFGPEHGFRGKADAGEKVESGVDAKTGLEVVSLYGKNRKPTPTQMEGIDVMLFDIQDIGSRHYTYIGTMAYAMEACAASGAEIWILDRPNPNGWYVDGPVLEKGNNSFIGMHEIPIVHGMTIGEYAQMLNGEGWLEGQVKAKTRIIKSEGYTHSMKWNQLGLTWTPPSPNIGTEYASYLYPGICWLEPTPVSLGRGTDEAFTIVGAPWFQLPQVEARTASGNLVLEGLSMKSYDFTPVSLPGKSKYPKFQDKLCKGLAFENRVEGKELMLAGIGLFAEMYRQHQSIAPGESFFKKGFHKWPGNKTFQKQIVAGDSPEEIYQSWQSKVDEFKAIRSKYLLYPDFE